MIPTPFLSLHGALAVLTLVTAQPALSQSPEHYRPTDVRPLMAKAKTIQDYQSLAIYFRYQEQLYRAKAQEQMTDYAHCVRNVTLSPKFQTRADLDREAYRYNLFKATRSAARARRYEQTLIANGVKPKSSVPLTISARPVEGIHTDDSRNTNSLLHNFP